MAFWVIEPTKTTNTKTQPVCLLCFGRVKDSKSTPVFSLSLWVCQQTRCQVTWLLLMLLLMMMFRSCWCRRVWNLRGCYHRCCGSIFDQLRHVRRPGCVAKFTFTEWSRRSKHRHWTVVSWCPAVSWRRPVAFSSRRRVRQWWRPNITAAKN